MNRIPATVTVLTFNSAKTLRACLESLRAFDDVLVLDGGSADDTLAIAAEFGARIERQKDTSGPIEDFTAVRRRSFELAKHDWIFWIDSDEYADEALIHSIGEAVGRGDTNLVYRASRLPVIGGRVIRYAYFLPDRVIRLVHRDGAEWASGKKVHEHLVPKSGVVVQDLEGNVYAPWDTLEAYRKKDRYYLFLAFNKPVKANPSLTRTLRSILKNMASAARILCVAAYLSVRYAHTGAALPFSYHWRFARYHLAIVKERFRQWFLGIHYVPPQA